MPLNKIRGHPIYNNWFITPQGGIEQNAITELDTMYKQLTSEERYYIATCLRQGLSKNQIAKQLNRSHTTITREIARNTGGRGYRYKQAHVFAGQRHVAKNKSTKLNDSIKKQLLNTSN
jgi:IS30 family transposase